MERKLFTDLLRFTKWLGYKDLQKAFSIKLLLLCIVEPSLIISSCLYTFYNWDNLEKRVNGLKGICLYILCFVYLIAFEMTWIKTKLVLETIEEGQYEFPFRVSQRRQMLERKIEDDLLKTNNTWKHALSGLAVGSSLSPILLFCVRVKQHGLENVTPQMLDLVPPVYYSDDYNMLPYFFIAVIMNCYFWALLKYIAQIVAVSPFLAMQLMAEDLKLVRLSLEEMDTIIEYNMTNRNYDQSMMLFISYLVDHKNSIHRKLKAIKIGMQLIAVSIQTFMSIGICETIFILVKGTEHIIKIQEGIFLLIIIFCLYCYDKFGENLTNEDEKLRHALYQCSWVDKPPWFKKALFIMMTRSNKPIEINFAGVYPLNLKSFVMTIRAAYSIYNVLNKF